MADQTQVTRTRRSRRNGEAQDTVQTSGQYDAAQEQIEEIDNIINDIVTPSNGEQSIVMGDDHVHDVHSNISSEELVQNFRQQSGE
ncbi:MAG: hypothetical protein JXA10_06705 [Anaerolineae bacterium]|nr:hypothetical protein [Anaerolineae bacterium]